MGGQDGGWFGWGFGFWRALIVKLLKMTTRVNLVVAL